jgi:hypothetical protein
MPAAKKTDRTPQMDANLQASKKRYETHAFDVQKQKLIHGLVNGKRKPTARTIEKYGLRDWINDKGELVVPAAHQPKPKIVVVQPPQQDITVKGVQRVVQTENPTIRKGPVSTAQVQEYFRSEQYQLDREADGYPRLKDNGKGYASGANVLVKLKLVKDKAQDIMPVLRDTDRVIKAVRERPGATENMQTTDFKFLHIICSQAPMVSEQLPESLTRDGYGKLLAQGNERQAQGGQLRQAHREERVQVAGHCQGRGGHVWEGQRGVSLFQGV